MIRLLLPGASRLQTAETSADLPADVLWIDLFNPGREEEKRVESLLGIDIPTREEMREIEESSRLYRCGEALHITVRVLFGLDTERPRTRAITFVLTPRCLVTVRYIDPHAFRHFDERLTRADEDGSLNTGGEVFVELLERIVDRAADVLEGIEGDLENISDAVFRDTAAEPAGKGAAGAVDSAPNPDKPEAVAGIPPEVDLQRLLKRLGRHNALGARLRESLLSIARLLPFLCGTHAPIPDPLRERLETLQRDVQSLTDYEAHTSQEIQFLLDSTLGLINLEQNEIIKGFTVAATLLMPPTVVAGIYGMNFKHMPELEWYFGYPFALMLMVLSAGLPYWYFKRKGWY